jgi:PAS domain S-box-containing protein
MTPILRFLIVVLLVAPAGSVVTVHARLAEQSGAGAPAVKRPEDASRPRRVLVLYWYNIENVSTVTFDQQVQAVLRRQGAGEFVHHSEYLEAGRFPGEEQQRTLRDYLRRKYRDRKIDVILTWGAPPLEFLLKYRKDLFPGTPVVFYSSEIDSVKHLVAEPLTGVLNPGFYETTMELALRLHPDAREAFVITGTASHDKLIERETSEQFKKFEGRVKFTYLTDLPFDELLATVKSLPRGSIILYARAAVGDAGGLAPGDVLDAVSRAAPVPVYCAWRSLLGNGSVGGIVDDPVAGARKAAEIAVRVARGARPQDIPTDSTPRVPTFDARQLARWGIPERALPAGSVVLFKEPTLWSEYKHYVIGAAVALALQTLMIGMLLAQRSRRRRVEAALRESEARFRLMADTAPVLVWRANVHKEYDFFNLPWLMFRGRTLEDESGHGWIAGVHPADVEPCVATYTSAFDDRRPFQIEYRLQRADGEYRWMLVSGVPRFAPDGSFQGYIGSCVDITERRCATEALEESERRYALATAAGSVGVWDWNLDSNDIWIDPALKQAIGFADAEIDNRLDSWLSHVHPDDTGRLLIDAHAHAHNNTLSFENEHRMLHRDGSIRWFLTRGSAVRLTDRRAVRIIGTDTDITERKNAEVRLEETRHELARVSRVTTLAQFAASVAHETSQPLNTILLNARACLRWLRGTAPSVDQMRSTLQDIADAAKQANEVMIRNRGMFSRHPVERQTLDVSTIVRDVVALARTRLNRSRVSIEMTLDPTLPEIVGDRVELQQVLLNLLLNGIESVEAANPASREIRIDTRRSDAAHVQISVRDAGVGLRDVDVKNLFTPFYSTKPMGTGVGLSISRFIVEDHGGRLWAEANDDGPGATFHFTVPIAAPVELPHIERPVRVTIH